MTYSIVISMVLNYREHKEVEKDHLIQQHPLFSRGSCIYITPSQLISLQLKKHINTTGVDTKEYFTPALLTELPPAYSRSYPPTCQPLVAAQPPVPRKAARVKKFIQVQCKQHDNCTARAQMQAGEESRKNKQLLLSSWHRANTGDSKMLVDSKAPLISK